MARNTNSKDELEKATRPTSTSTLRPYRIPSTHRLAQWVSRRKSHASVCEKFSQFRCHSVLLAMSNRVRAFFPSRGYKPPPTLPDRLNLHLSFQGRRFSTPYYDKCPDVAMYTIGPLLLFHNLSSAHCTLKVSEHSSLRAPPAAHSYEWSHPETPSCVQRCLNALTPSYLWAWLNDVIRWSGVLRCASMIQSKTRWGTVRSLA